MRYGLLRANVTTEKQMTTIRILLWVCQIYLAYLFYRSAYKKVTKYETVKNEFLRWGYPFPGQLTFFLIIVWILAGAALLVPALAGFSALVLALFMIVAFATLVVHGEYRRLIEPTQPLVLSTFIIVMRFDEIINTITSGP